jgi:hypothetical protein
MQEVVKHFCKKIVKSPIDRLFLTENSLFFAKSIDIKKK